MKSIQEIEQKIEDINKHIEITKTEGIVSFYGQELGTAKLVRDGRDFRIFAKELEKAKSGKAVLVELHVWIKKDGEEFAVVRGNTYLPNFVLENKDVYWILKNKIDNATTDNPEHGNISIDSSYVPAKHRRHIDYWSNGTKTSAEEHFKSFIKSLEYLRDSYVGDLKLQINVPAFMEMVA